MDYLPLRNNIYPKDSHITMIHNLSAVYNPPLHILQVTEVSAVQCS